MIRALVVLVAFLPQLALAGIDDRVTGAILAAKLAIKAVKQAPASRNVTATQSGNEICIPFATGVTPDATYKATRISGLACDLPKSITDKVRDEPCVLEIQAPPSNKDDVDLPNWLDIPGPTSIDVDKRANARRPECEVLIFSGKRAQALGAYRCACWDGVGACTVTGPALDGGTSTGPCPRGVTMSPGSWSGAGAIPKACTTRAGRTRQWGGDGGPATDESWPDSCPPQ